MSLYWIIGIWAAAFGLVIWTSFFRKTRFGIVALFWITFGLGLLWSVVSLWNNIPVLAAPAGFFWLTLIIVLSYVVTMWLILRSGHGYTVHDTEAHSIDYGGVIKEGHGGLTAFLWMLYLGIFVWMIIYLVQHGSEFSAVFSN